VQNVKIQQSFYVDTPLLCITFTKPVKKQKPTDVDIPNKKITCTYLISDSAPIEPSNSNSVLPTPTVSNSFSVNFYEIQNANVSNSPLTKPTLFIILHGSLMLFAWVFCSSAALFSARYLRRVGTKIWFPIHWSIVIVMGISTVAGLVFAFIRYPGDLGIDNPHAYLGLSIIGLFLIQIIIGVLIHFLWDPYRNSPPLRDKAHWIIGYILLLAALGNCAYGIYLMQEKYRLYFIIVGFIGLAINIGLIIYGEIVYDEDNHDDIIKKELKNERSSMYVAPKVGIMGKIKGILGLDGKSNTSMKRKNSEMNINNQKNPNETYFQSGFDDSFRGRQEADYGNYSETVEGYDRKEATRRYEDYNSEYQDSYVDDRYKSRYDDSYTDYEKTFASSYRDKSSFPNRDRY
ncbi:hypothetical protein ROZALSC1DRAFT_29267, partial [Rozella allomycis CSF55]